jgi:hypothetical protein
MLINLTQIARIFIQAIFFYRQSEIFQTFFYLFFACSDHQEQTVTIDEK